ncbi:hypothetical protein [Streptomyces sp. NPDC051014]|uniref:hypothetical protein n=1 Tax=Streptomyces sp. NPDC051014 TaxID=3155751 RepID=UPI0033D6E7E7
MEESAPHGAPDHRGGGVDALAVDRLGIGRRVYAADLPLRALEQLLSAPGHSVTPGHHLDQCSRVPAATSLAMPFRQPLGQGPRPVDVTFAGQYQHFQRVVGRQSGAGGHGAGQPGDQTALLQPRQSVQGELDIDVDALAQLVHGHGGIVDQGQVQGFRGLVQSENF